MPTSIALVDDKAVNRNTFQQKITPFDDLNLVFMAINGHDCIEQLQGLPLNKQPEIIFVDLEMPELNGIQTIQIAKPLYPHIHFIILTVFDDDENFLKEYNPGRVVIYLKMIPLSSFITPSPIVKNMAALK